MNTKQMITIMISAVAYMMLTPGSEAVSQKAKRTTTKSTGNATPIAPAVALPTSGKLSIEAGLIFNSGDVKPVARTTFYLLDQDLGEILKPLGETPGTLRSGLDFLNTLSDSPKAKAQYERLKTTVQQHIVATATTGFDGKAQFSDVRAGLWFLYGAFHVGENDVAWHLKVEIKPGAETAVVLDNYNRSF
jgi:hypothetical protein